MHTSQFSIRDLRHFISRRKKYLIIPPIVVTALCVVGAYMLPKRFESTTTIWVQPDEILNPLVNYQMAVQLASSDRLETFIEIIYSRKTIETVIDSVGMGNGVEGGIPWDNLIEHIRQNIKTARKGSDSFTISYLDTDPVRAQKMVSFLARTFIETRIKGEARRNELTVEFFERKLREYEEKFETTQHDMVTLLLQRMRERPTGSGGLYNRLDDLDKQIQRYNDKQKTDQRAVAQLAEFPDGFRTDEGKQALAELRHTDLPYAEELRTALQQYDDVSSRYTPLFPEVGKAENQIQDILRKMRVAVESELTGLSAQISELKASRQQTIDELMKYSVDQQEDLSKKSNYNLYQRLYEDMKTKLEQAKITQELGKNAENSFIIIDPARVPAKPSKPNQPLIIAGGGLFSIMLGIAAGLVAEYMDTRMRSLADLEAFHIPVIALLPDLGGNP